MFPATVHQVFQSISIARSKTKSHSCYYWHSGKYLLNLVSPDEIFKQFETKMLIPLNTDDWEKTAIHESRNTFFFF